MLLVIVQSWNNLLFLPILIINSLIGIVQELRARKILSNMQLLHHYTAIAVRDGKEIQLETKDLVQDDIVLFSAGDQIYADAKIVSGELKVNESQLTGEADEIAKQISDTVMSGSFVVSGKAYARLEKVGDESYINQLTLKAKEVSGKEESEMVRSVNNLVKVIGFLIIPLGLLLFFQSYVTNHESFQVSIVSTVGAIIGMIPEGLYLLMTLALALGSASLARQQVLLNSMKGIESLSRVDVLCVDKTGTITGTACRGRRSENSRGARRVPEMVRFRNDRFPDAGADFVARHYRGDEIPTAFVLGFRHRQRRRHDDRRQVNKGGVMQIVKVKRVRGRSV